MSFNIENYFSDVSAGNTILYYKGNVDSDVINHVLDTVEDKMVVVNVHSKLRKKVYNVLVESLGLVVVKKVSDGYRIITGNFVRVENIEKLEEKIKRINRSSHEEIKELYKFILNHQRISAKGGGGLGLVDIARKTGNKLEYSFKEYNSHYSFFYLDILVNEEKQNNF